MTLDRISLLICFFGTLVLSMPYKSFGQEDLSSGLYIVIDKSTKNGDTINQFREIGGIGRKVPINHSRINEGFKIINDDPDKKGAKLYSLPDQTSPVEIESLQANSDTFYYNKGIIKSDTFLKLRLEYNHSSSIEIVLFISDTQNSNEGNGEKKQDDCFEISILPEGDCKKLAKDNLFGEDVATYQKNKVVYVLDFNSGNSNPTYYKISRLPSRVEKDILSEEEYSIPEELRELLWNHTELSKYDRTIDSLSDRSILIKQEIDCIIELIKHEDNESIKIKLNNFKQDFEKHVSQIYTQMNTYEENRKRTLEALKDKLPKKLIKTLGAAEDESVNDAIFRINENYYVYNFLKKQDDLLLKNNKATNLYKDGLWIRPVNFSTERLKAKNTVEFKIHNVNKFIYDVKIDDTLMTLHSEESKLFNDLFTGEGSSFLKTLQDALEFGFSKSSEKEEVAGTQSSGQKNRLNDLLQCFYNNYSLLQDQLIRSTNPCASFECCPSINTTAFSVLSRQLLELRLIVSSLSEKVEDLKSTHKNLIVELEKLKDCASEKSQFEAKKKTFEEFDGSDTEGKKKAKDAMDEAKKKLDKCDSDRKVLQTKIDSIVALIKNYNGVEYLSFHLPTEEKIRKLIVYVSQMTSRANVFVHDIPQLRGTHLQLDLAITANDTFPSVSSYDPKPFSIPIVHNGLFSFSSGIFLGFGDNLQAKTYNWRKLPGNGGTLIGQSDNIYELAESGYQEMPAGFSALGSIQYRISPWLSAGGSFGAGITVEKDPRIAYLLGPSIGIGAYRQITITGGVLFTKVNVLKNTLFQEGYTYHSTGDNLPSINYYSDMRMGGFISLTYTPFKTRAFNPLPKKKIDSSIQGGDQKK